MPDRRSGERLADGNTYCQRHSLSAAGYFRGQRLRQLHAAEALVEIPLMDLPHRVEVGAKARFDDLGKHRPAILAALTVAHREVREILGRVSGVAWLVLTLLYGSGMRLKECLQLRVQHIDFSQNGRRRPAAAACPAAR